MGFSHIPVDGSEKMADDLMESIEPFSFDGAVDFQTAYLAGYLADRYDVSADESINRANERLRHTTEQAFRDTVMGYATVTTESVNVRIANGSAKYALYPVWILNTTWKDKKYTFAMNGQTGKMTGTFPICPKRSAAWFGGICAAVTAIVTLIQWFVL